MKCRRQIAQNYFETPKVSVFKTQREWAIHSIDHIGLRRLLHLPFGQPLPYTKPSPNWMNKKQMPVSCSVIRLGQSKWTLGVLEFSALFHCTCSDSGHIKV